MRAGERGEPVGFRRRAGFDVHRRAPLALVREQRRDLVGDGRVDRLDVVGLVGLEEQQRVGSVMRTAEPGEEVRVARRDDAVDGQPAGVAVIGMQAIPLPRIVTEHDRRP